MADFHLNTNGKARLVSHLARLVTLLLCSPDARRASNIAAGERATRACPCDRLCARAQVSSRPIAERHRAARTARPCRDQLGRRPRPRVGGKAGRTHRLPVILEQTIASSSLQQATCQFLLALLSLAPAISFLLLLPLSKCATTSRTRSPADSRAHTPWNSNPLHPWHHNLPSFLLHQPLTSSGHHLAGKLKSCAAVHH